MSQHHEVAVAFMRLPVTSRLEIARKLGLDDGLDDMRGDKASLEVCRRVFNEGCFDDFVVAVRSASPREQNP